jgi:hypothetical protein
VSAKRLKDFLIAFSLHFSLQLEIATHTYTYIYMLQPEDIKKMNFHFEDTYEENVIIRKVVVVVKS